VNDFYLKMITELIEVNPRSGGLDEYPVQPIVEEVVQAMIELGFVIIPPGSEMKVGKIQ
jgi:hypothetical protein